MDDQIMTVKELAKYLMMHEVTIYKMIKNGTIPSGRKIGKYWRFPKKDIDRWLLENRNDYEGWDE